MFDITLLEVAQSVLFLIKGLATVGLFAGVPVALDWIVTDFTGEHIIPLVLAAGVWVKLRYFRKTERPLIYRGSRRMPMSSDRVKARVQREIDASYDEAWFHNLVVDIQATKVGWDW